MAIIPIEYYKNTYITPTHYTVTLYIATVRFNLMHKKA